jgi:hypothetical protein
MTQQDKELLKWYYLGFHHELGRKTKTTPEDPILNVAYRLGTVHAIIGDDIPSIDYLTDKETIQLIKEEYAAQNQNLV